MTCLMAYHNEKRTEAISIVLQSISRILIECSIAYLVHASPFVRVIGPG
jgi:hypothetical protein